MKKVLLSPSRFARNSLILAAFVGLAASLFGGLAAALPAAAVSYGLANIVALAVWSPFSAVMGFRSPVYPRIFTYISGMNGIGNGGTGTLGMPSGYRYHDLNLFTTIAGVLSDPTTVIEWVRIFVNSTLMLDATPAQLINTAKLFRITPSTGQLPIFFTEPWRPERVATMNSWPIGQSDVMTLQVKFLNPGGGAVNLTVGASYDQGQNIGPDGKPFLRIIKRFNLSENMPAGAKDITDIDTSYPILRLFLSPSAGTISDILVTADSKKILEATKQQNQDLLNQYLITGSFFEFPIVFDYPNNGAALLTNNLVVKQTSSGANTTTVHVMQVVPGYR